MRCSELVPFSSLLALVSPAIDPRLVSVSRLLGVSLVNATAGARAHRRLRRPARRRTGGQIGAPQLASMYIRVKRNKSTYFIQCEPTETTLSVKQKLHSLIDQPPSNQQLVLLATNDVLEDSKTLADQKVENDSVVALALRKDDDEFEEIFIARPEDFMSSS
ncbi:uncharacterized protein LOC120694679 isoform X1 [Panicum virgatum]|uniref:Ubiquitin-like domain-containing protein n=2 Tax=Panicum virgatum TaxID=38727 RepID=A0A8T0WPV6_PANVG|nr:uncharacterized protein LOC120694679 isoform X1 [Panicum virgatum]KAG2647144.1 hypothetical protein PVAP13_2KG563400 [Panicum virgatum]